ncbi:MAG: glycosyltransferase family 4 protein [Bacteroidia bacterium]|nr:glycosyltransferase family 4 protein [Bacteroidia bacterium]
MMQLIRFFLNNSCRVTLACDAHQTEHSDDLSGYPVNTLKIELNDTGFDNQLLEINPSIVLFDRFMTEEKYGWRVAEQCPEAMRILDTEDLHCLRKARQTALKHREAIRDVLLQSDVSKREIASIYRCDLSLIISTYEMELLQSIFNIDPALLHYVPLMPDALSKQDVTAWPEYTERTHFVSIGNFLHEPNTDAVLYLKEKLWPMIRKELPDAELHIYGAYANEKIKHLHQEKQGFLLKGRAKDSGEVIRSARVLLAPLRFGAGIKGKLLEAMQCGTPSVTTSIGAEGMFDGSAWSGYIADDPSAFVSSAVKLYTSAKEWKTAREQGLAILHDFYDTKKHSTALLERLLHTQRHLNLLRTSNFIGAMLLHHSMASTKYMSRWIELKNKAHS